MRSWEFGAQLTSFPGKGHSAMLGWAWGEKPFRAPLGNPQSRVGDTTGFIPTDKAARHSVCLMVRPLLPRQTFISVAV